MMEERHLATDDAEIRQSIVEGMRTYLETALEESLRLDQESKIDWRILHKRLGEIVDQFTDQAQPNDHAPRRTQLPLSIRAVLRAHHRPEVKGRSP